MLRWLERIGWRSGTRHRGRQRWAALILRDPEHALRCFAAFQAKAAAMSVRDPAAVFDAIFEGRVRAVEPSGISGELAKPGAGGDVRAQLWRLAEQDAKRRDQG